MKPEETVREQKRMGLGMMVLAWITLLGLGALFFSDALERQFNPNRELETRYSEAGVREVVLQRNRYGHYVTSGEINGHPVTFMLDTGATGVAIPDAVAQRLGIARGRAYRTQTANGTAVSYAATLDSVAVGNIVLHNVQAGIAPGMGIEEVLLGMSFLKHIEFTQRGDSLILRQYAPPS
ncbi:retropepsin-like aspartic protease family protein [Pseudohalioglobus lutimaris]|uniref:TIGR02281 family clan AA aspartic protease n=1 Tax=Pseudohalioglobus lutimaris TaxID=1737061 RepID=A0A2N5WYE0_9GAMM|nr:TIGR02281 family clan AA aspartic protease [Pseudohalioglobus lutimaris]PLW67265.1 TIGR02281 family clan AA aspartic protease [Pseudohalioglobus lutimaris]